MIPCGILMVVSILSLTYVFLPNTPLEMGWTIPLMVGIGACVGATYLYTLKRSSQVFFGILTGLTLLLTVAGGVYYSSQKIDFDTLIACEVCGLKTLEAPETTCPVCQSTLDTPTQLTEGYASAEEFVKGEQFIYFFPNQQGEPIDFYNHYQGPRPYQAAPDWEPSIAGADISEMYSLLREIAEGE